VQTLIEEREKCRETCGLDDNRSPLEDNGPVKVPAKGPPKVAAKDASKSRGKEFNGGGTYGLCVCGRGGTGCGRSC